MIGTCLTVEPSPKPIQKVLRSRTALPILVGILLTKCRAQPNLGDIIKQRPLKKMSPMVINPERLHAWCHIKSLSSCTSHPTNNWISGSLKSCGMDVWFLFGSKDEGVKIPVTSQDQKPHRVSQDVQQLIWCQPLWEKRFRVKAAVSVLPHPFYLVLLLSHCFGESVPTLESVWWELACAEDELMTVVVGYMVAGRQPW